jgi:outer membrane receptor protein involved in Fe transport
VVPQPAFVESRMDGSMHPRFQSATFRSEYRLTQRDALSADAMVSGGRFARETNAFYTDLNAARDVIESFDQFSEQRSRNLSQDYTLAFRRTEGPSTPVFSTELRYTRNRWLSDNELAGMLRQVDGSAAPMFPREHDATSARMPAWNLQTDYTHAFGKRTKLESGFKGTLRRNRNDFAASFLDATSGAFVPDPSRGNAFDYRESIGAVYGVLSRQIGKAQTQVGLRLEDAATRFTSSSGVSHDNRYASAFPSAIVSYNFTALRQAKLSYSRRVTRPNPFQLSPIPYREDARHEFRGNPALRPEYTDALELGLQETRSWGSVQLNPYLRKTAHAVRYIQLVDDAGITVSTFDNVASNQTVGADLNVNYRRGPLSLFGGASGWRYTSDAANLPGDLSTRATVWSLRANVTWKFSRLTDGQLFTNYRAPSATEGGTQTAFAMVNLAVRHKLWGDQGSLSLRVSDPFSTMSFGYRTADGRVIELSERRFGQRGLFITLSRNFGQQLKLQPRQQEPEAQQQPGPP